MEETHVDIYTMHNGRETSKHTVSCETDIVVFANDGGSINLNSLDEHTKEKSLLIYAKRAGDLRINPVRVDSWKYAGVFFLSGFFLSGFLGFGLRHRLK